MWTHRRETATTPHFLYYGKEAVWETNLLTLCCNAFTDNKIQPTYMTNHNAPIVLPAMPDNINIMAILLGDQFVRRMVHLLRWIESAIPQAEAWG